MHGGRHGRTPATHTATASCGGRWDATPASPERAAGRRCGNRRDMARGGACHRGAHTSRFALPAVRLAVPPPPCGARPLSTRRRTARPPSSLPSLAPPLPLPPLTLPPLPLPPPSPLEAKPPPHQGYPDHPHHTSARGSRPPERRPPRRWGWRGGVLPGHHAAVSGTGGAGGGGGRDGRVGSRRRGRGGQPPAGGSGRRWRRWEVAKVGGALPAAAGHAGRVAYNAGGYPIRCDTQNLHEAAQDVVTAPGNLRPIFVGPLPLRS